MYKGYKYGLIVVDQWRDIVNGGNGWSQEA